MDAKTLTRLPRLLTCAVLAAACGDGTGPGVVLEPNALCSQHSRQDVVAFGDPMLEQLVRVMADHDPYADVALTCAEVASITTLQDAFASQGSIRPILSLEGLQNLTGLTYLSLVDHGFDDIGPLAGLTKLQTVDLGLNAITDIGPLAGLTQLEWLTLTENPITDIGPLSGLVSLRHLDLNNLGFSDTGPLQGLTGLTSLWMQTNAIRDISALSGLTSLDQLYLGANQIVDISPLAGLVQLGQLFLDYNQISDISAISGLLAVTELGLSNNSVTDISALSGSRYWRVLYLLDNPDLSDIQPLLDPNLSGRLVSLYRTSVSCVDVAALEAVWSTVASDCP